MYASLFTQDLREGVDAKLLRHIILNSIRANLKKFKGEFGELVIAADGRFSWRREVFPYYKGKRKEDRAESTIDWGPIFEAMETVREELKQFFPYRVIRVDGAEADDVIGVLCQTFGTPLNSGEPIVIISGDKDFKQLHKYGNVRQYSPVLKKYIKCKRSPEHELKELIIRGDDGDGIPNMFMHDSFLMDIPRGRAKPIYEKKLNIWLNQEPEEFCDEQTLIKYRRNERLIDLEFVPEEIKKSIIQEYESQAGKSKAKLFNYFVSRRLNNLMESLSDF